MKTLVPKVEKMVDPDERVWAAEIKKRLNAMSYDATLDHIIQAWRYYSNEYYMAEWTNHNSLTDDGLLAAVQTVMSEGG